MRKIRLTTVLAVVAITLAVCVDASAVGKKRPKRRRAKNTSSKQVTLPLPAVLAAPVTVTANTSSRLVTSDASAAASGATSAEPATTPSTNGSSGPTPVSVGDLVISEFRVRGPNGMNDEFI